MNKNNYPSPRTADRIVTVAVDVQNDFCPGGSLAVDKGNRVVSPLNDTMSYTRNRGGIVIATGDQHPEETPHFDIWPVHCVEGTQGAAFHPDLDIHTTDIIISKGMGQTNGYSGFEGTAIDGSTLERIITPDNPRQRVVLLLGGLATDYCVKATALDAAKIAKETRRTGKGIIDVYLLIDAIRAVDIEPGDGKRAIEEMQEAGVYLITTDELLGRAS